MQRLSLGVRLGLFQLSLGILSVLVLGLLNRLLIQEIQLPAVLAALAPQKNMTSSDCVQYRFYRVSNKRWGSATGAGSQWLADNVMMVLSLAHFLLIHRLT